MFWLPRPLATRALFVLAFLLLPPLTACDPNVKPLRLAIPSFDTSGVQGIGLWRQEEISGDWVLVGEIPFSINQPYAGPEFAHYELRFPDGNVMSMSSGVQRDELDPERITVSLFWFRSTEPGAFRASAYNAGGHSALSTETIVL